MVHVASESAFHFFNFVFRKGAIYDNNDTEAANRTIQPAEVPGLTQPYSFSHTVSLWNGTGSAANATEFYHYTGSALAANAYGSPVSGRVTGLFVGDAQGQAAMIGTSINAADIRAASLTSTREDDMAILRAALSGDDTAHLSRFADRFSAQDGNDLVIAGAGNDTIEGNQGRDRLFGEAGDDLLTGGYGYDRLNGGTGIDTLHGDAGDDTLVGMQDKDFLFGGAGDDELSGGYGYDRLNGGTGSDTLHGDAGDDTLVGMQDNDFLFGGAGDDALSGGYGRDLLNGGIGADTLSGGVDQARDVFVFETTGDSANLAGSDLLLDFVSRTDDIDLSQIDANTALAGNQAFSFGGTTAGNYSVWFTATANGVTVNADVNGDARADLVIRVEDVTSLVAGDFLL